MIYSREYRLVDSMSNVSEDKNFAELRNGVVSLYLQLALMEKGAITYCSFVYLKIRERVCVRKASLIEMHLDEVRLSESPLAITLKLADDISSNCLSILRSSPTADNIKMKQNSLHILGTYVSSLAGRHRWDVYDSIRMDR